MKKLTTAAVAAMALLCAGRTQSQTLSIGGRLDFTMTKWTFSSSNPLGGPFEDWETKPLFGFGGGFPIECRLHPRFAVQTEVNLTRRGFAIKASEDQPNGHTLTYRGEFIFRYTDIPLLAKVYLTTGEREWYLLAGASWSRARSGTIKATVTDCFLLECDSDSDSEPLDLAEDFPRTRTDHGLHLGIGWQKKLPGGALFFEGRYYHGLKRLSEEGAEEDIRNRGGMLSMGGFYDIVKQK